MAIVTICSDSGVQENKVCHCSDYFFIFEFLVCITICSDFGTQEIKSVTVSIVSPSIFHEVMGPDAMILIFWMLSFKPAFSLSSFTFIKGLFSSSSLSAIRVVSSVYLRLLIFLPSILFPAWASSSLAFHMMYSAYKLNKQGDSVQLWSTPFPVLNQSIVPCPVLTVAFWPAHRFLRRQVRWSGILSVCGVTKSQTRPSKFHFLNHFLKPDKYSVKKRITGQYHWWT